MEIRRLLREGQLSQRKIAGQLKVSRGTVHAIACGKRTVINAPERRATDDWTVVSGPPTRCPTCGGLVQMPCLACRVRRLLQTRKLQGRGPARELAAEGRRVGESPAPNAASLGVKAGTSLAVYSRTLSEKRIESIDDESIRRGLA
jgi:hypothetical protein